MSIRTLPHPDWTRYFDAFSKGTPGADQAHHARVRILSADDGDLPVTDWVPLLGLTYDAKDDLLEVQMKGLDHLVARPVEIHVDEAGGELSSFEVVRSDGTREIVELR